MHGDVSNNSIQTKVLTLMVCFYLFCLHSCSLEYKSGLYITYN